MIKLRIWSDGDKTWFLNGFYHRANGPAFVWHWNSTTKWFWYGYKVTEYEHMMLVVQEQTNG